MSTKKSGDFRNEKRCQIARSHDSISLRSVKGAAYDNAIIVKEILHRLFTGECSPSDVPDLVNQGIESDYIVEEEGARRNAALSEQILRAYTSEKRTPYFYGERTITAGDYEVSVKPDAVFFYDDTIELVLYRIGKPSVTMNGRKKDHSAKNCIELYLLLQYGKQLVKKGEQKTIRASYYFMRKKTDTKGVFDPVFFSDGGGNIVYLEDKYYNNGQPSISELDDALENLLADYAQGEICEGDACKNCAFQIACHYVKPPVHLEVKEETKKADIHLSSAQERVVSFEKGVCRVNAGAGSGKTECITQRVLRLLQKGVRPQEILLITFTDAGANEMKRRVAARCKDAGLFYTEDDIIAVTFNKFAYSIVKDKYADCGFTKPPVVIDQVRNAVIISQLLNETLVPGLDYLNFKMNMPNCKGALACAAAAFEQIKVHQIDRKEPDAGERLKYYLTHVAPFLNDSSIRSLLDLYEKYDRRLKEDGLLQFSDQEPLMFHVLEQYPDYLESFGFRHIIVDEFQDSNDIQIETCRRLAACKSFESLMVVGDDSQSIFSFRYTTPENILQFFDRIGQEGTDYYLVENYRSTPEILGLANGVNALNTSRIDKNLIAVKEGGLSPSVMGFYSKAQEYSFIAGQIQDLHQSGEAYENMAFLAAKRSELVSMASVLSSLGIPWVMATPMRLKENSKVMAALSLADAFWQPEATQPYFNYLTALYDGGIFDSLADDEIMQKVEEMQGVFYSIDSFDIPQQRVIFHQYLDALKGGTEDELYDYFLTLLADCEDFQSELEYMRNFKEFGDGVEKKMEQKYKGVVLSTAHSSKGLEWNVVFNSITNYDAPALHGGWHCRSAVEETRRLLFVSMTRAKCRLYVTGQYVAYGSKEDRTYNQFLKELYELSGKVFAPVETGTKNTKTRTTRTKKVS